MTVSSDPLSLVFTGEQHRLLANAVERAFPGYDDLAMFVRYRLDLNLPSVVAPVHKLSIVVFELLKQQRAEGHLLRFVASARAARPDNPELAFAAASLGLATQTPSRPELESIIRRTSVPFDVAVWRQQLARREACVCRVEVAGPRGPGFGTGFLVGADLVLTNHHVVAPLLSDGRAAGTPPRFRFDYKALGDGTTVAPGIEVTAAADWLVDASPHSPIDTQPLPKNGVPEPGELDYALIRLARPAGDEPIEIGPGTEPGAPARGCIEVRREDWPFESGRTLYILQHPRAAPLKLAMELDADLLCNENRTRVRYATGTEPGSSGSPCFNERWELVAMHHAGDPAASDLFPPRYNEGIPISAIVALLESRGKAGGLAIR